MRRRRFDAARGRARPLVLLLAAALAGCAADTEPGPERVEVTLLGTTDVHGYLLPWDYAEARYADSSLVQIATLVDSVRAEDPHVLLFDSGDFLQGSEVTDYVAEVGIDSVHPVIAAMNALRYDAVAMGNHEYNHGLAFLDEALAGAEFPVLAANIYVAGTDSTAYPPYVVLERGGVRIGVLGFCTPGVAIWDRHHVEGRLEFHDIVAAAKRWMPELLAEEPDLVVVAAHSGIGPGSTYSEEESGVPEEDAVGRLAREVEGIHVIFAGHDAGPEPPTRIGDALVTHAGHLGETLASVRVTLERTEEGRWEVVDREGALLWTAGVAPHPDVEELVRPAHEATQAWLDEELAYTPEEWSAEEARVRPTAAAGLITSAMREAAGAELASTAIFDPSVSFGPGPITRRDILALYLYPNRLSTVRVSGQQIRDYLEKTARYFHQFPSDELVNDSVIAFNYDVIDGLEYRLDISRPVGERVTELRFRGRPVAPTDSFTMALNSYRQAGGGGFDMLAEAPVLHEGTTLISDIIIDFVRQRDTLRSEEVLRETWRVEPPEAVRRLVESGAVLSRY